MGKKKKTRNEKVLSESPYLFVVSKRYLELLLEEEKAIAREYGDYSFYDPYLENIRKQQLSFHLEMVQKFQDQLRFQKKTKEITISLIIGFFFMTISSLASGITDSFRPSVVKKEENAQFFPINCHTHELIVDEGAGKSSLFAS